MVEPRLVRDETPVEFFREQLAKAMEHQRIETSAFTEYAAVKWATAFVGHHVDYAADRV